MYAPRAVPQEIISLQESNRKFREDRGLSPEPYRAKDLDDVVSALDRIAVALERLAFGVVTDES